MSRRKDSRDARSYGGIYSVTPTGYRASREDIYILFVGMSVAGTACSWPGRLIETTRSFVGW